MPRDPYDGQPYYCALCGAGWGEFQACEDVDCKLESEASATMRAQRRRAQTSDSTTILQRAAES